MNRFQGRILRPVKQYYRPSPLRSLALSTPLIFAPHFAIAQNDAESSAVLDPISVTATEVAPGGVQIREDQIDRTNATDIKDIYATEAAVNTGGGSDVSRKVYVNGFEDTNLNVKIDGARQLNSTFHHLGTAIIDPGLLKTVRVETGVGPADVGPGALGGSIAYETKDARDLLDRDQVFGGFTRLHYDTNVQGFSEALTLAAQYEGFESLLYVSEDGGNNYTDGDGVEVLGTKPDMRNYLGKFAWSGRTGSRVEVVAGYLRDNSVRPNRANFGALANGAPPTFQKYNRRTYSVSYADENPSDLINPELVLSYNRSSFFVDNLAFGPFTFDLQSETTSYNGKLANTFTSDLGYLRSGKFTAGFDFYRDKGRGDIEGGFGGNVPLEITETSTNIGGFMQARLGISEKLRTSLGGRFDYQWFEGIEGTDITGSGLSGNLNLEYDVIEGLTPYAGAGTTYGGIPIGESTIYNFAGQWRYEGLTSSRSVNYKIGLKAEFGGFSGDVNFYYNELYDTHDRGDVNRNTTRDLLSRGVNIAAQYDYGSGFVRGAYSHNRFRSDGDILVTGLASYHGLQLGDIFTAEIGHYLFQTGVRLGAYVEKTLDDDSNQAAVNDGYTVFNIYGQWTPESLDTLTLRLDIKNLLDRTYVDRATSGFDNAQVIPFNEPGRTFLLTAKVEF